MRPMVRLALGPHNSTQLAQTMGGAAGASATALFAMIRPARRHHPVRDLRYGGHADAFFLERRAK